MTRNTFFAVYIICTILSATFHVKVFCTRTSSSQCEERKSPSNGTLQDDINTTFLNKNHFSIPRNGRLPTTMYPVAYNLALKAYLNNASYDGAVKILVDVKEETNLIILNMLDIITKNESTKVSRVSSEADFIEEIPIQSQTYEASLQFFVITLNQTLIPGDLFEVHVDFRGTLNDKLVGFYLSFYKDSENREVRVASTQFSPTDARRAFPCFDEPKYKATFTLSIERDEDVFALSNMPVIETKPVNGSRGRYVDHFDTTVRMSTYIVGFLVSDFVNKTSIAVNDTIFSVWTRENALEQANYALSVGPKLLEFLQNYFHIEYPLPKLDMAAIPNFKFSGMENWGLIMYRESALLFDPLFTTVQRKRRIMSVVAHEIAHMWFGNLVTPEWWSDLWLKEGFANFMGFKAADHIEPSWRMMEYLVWSTMQSAFALDSLHSSHPINVNVTRPDRISEIFDAISYNKGASIIHMMQQFLTENVYKEGMRTYVMELQYKNAVQEDLWYHLDNSWKKNGNVTTNPSLQDIMETWTLQEGYPVVHVHRNGSRIFLTQERFLVGDDYKNCSTAPELFMCSTNCSRTFQTTATDQLNSTGCLVHSSVEDLPKEQWWIPISFVEENSPTFDRTEPITWMSPDVRETMIHNVSSCGWYLLNVQRSGYFRVNYDNLNWIRLLKQLQHNHSSIHHLNRVQIIDDALNFARIELMDYDLALRMTTYMKNETELSVWTVFLSNFAYMYQFAEFTPEADVFRKYLEKLIAPVYKKYGLKDVGNDSYNDQSLRALLTKWACRIGYKPCLNKAKELFMNWLNSNDSERPLAFSINVKPTVLCTGIKSANRTQWFDTLKAYMQSNIQTEKADILIALGCTEDQEILTEYLSSVLNSTSGIIKQDASYVFQGVSQTQAGRNLAWNLVKERWRFLVEFFGSGSNALWKIFESSTSGFSSIDLLEELIEFRMKEEGFLGSARQTVDRAIEETKLNVIWNKNFLNQVLKWMEAN